MSQIDSEQLLLAASETQMLYVSNQAKFAQANLAVRKFAHNLTLDNENPFAQRYQPAITEVYMSTLQSVDARLAMRFEARLNILKKVVDRVCTLSFDDEPHYRKTELSLVGRDSYRRFNMRVIRSGLEPSVPVYLRSLSFGLVPYIEAATEDSDDELYVIPGIRIDPPPDIGMRVVSLPWSTVDWIEVEGI